MEFIKSDPTNGIDLVSFLPVQIEQEDGKMKEAEKAAGLLGADNDEDDSALFYNDLMPMVVSCSLRSLLPFSVGFVYLLRPISWKHPIDFGLYLTLILFMIK